MQVDIAIHWFRQDLRLSDNPALSLASKHAKVMPIYILDDVNAGNYTMGAASKWWLYHSLTALNKSLSGNLSFYLGDPYAKLVELCLSYKISAVYWNRCYEPWQIERDEKIKKALKSKGILVKTTSGFLLWEPFTVKKDDGTPYKVFTPFYKKGCLKAKAPRRALKMVDNMNYQLDNKHSVQLQQLKLLPKIRWDKMLIPHWQIGELAAHIQFKNFLTTGLANYKNGRNLLAEPYVSKLSPHLHFGEISPNQLWHAVLSRPQDSNTEHFLSELGWREFSYSQLYYNKDLPTKNLQAKFDKFPWKEDKNALKAWQIGQTGVPVVDAGMRQLWQTGYMHNRARMIVGSFLVKNMLLDWRCGERWFWDTLVDADLANNSASWQWVAGCGADAAPYFRIFNPVMQGHKFDPKGKYVRHFVPEIAALSDEYLFSPWQASSEVLAKSDIVLGKDYPYPIVDLKTSRQKALLAFDSLKNN